MIYLPRKLTANTDTSIVVEDGASDVTNDISHSIFDDHVDTFDVFPLMHSVSGGTNAIVMTVRLELTNDGHGYCIGPSCIAL